ncbi:hypothetical protein STEG23_028767, partial [Scotinomys teguina]
HMVQMLLTAEVAFLITEDLLEAELQKRFVKLTTLAVKEISNASEEVLKPTAPTDLLHKDASEKNDSRKKATLENSYQFEIC